MKNKKTLWMLLTGLLIGAIAVVLVAFGNPKNMGFCIACFLRDIGRRPVGLHRAAISPVHPAGDHRPGAGRPDHGSGQQGVPGPGRLVRRSPRFVLGMFVMVGALMFLGCPLRMVLRLGGGDLNARGGPGGLCLRHPVGHSVPEQRLHACRRTYEHEPAGGRRDAR